MAQYCATISFYATIVKSIPHHIHSWITQRLYITVNIVYQCRHTAVHVFLNIALVLLWTCRHIGEAIRWIAHWTVSYSVLLSVSPCECCLFRDEKKNDNSWKRIRTHVLFDVPLCDSVFGLADKTVVFAKPFIYLGERARLLWRISFEHPCRQGRSRGVDAGPARDVCMCKVRTRLTCADHPPSWSLAG